jgi:hypothetical protein
MTESLRGPLSVLGLVGLGRWKDGAASGMHNVYEGSLNERLVGVGQGTGCFHALWKILVGEVRLCWVHVYVVDLLAMFHGRASR